LTHTGEEEADHLVQLTGVLDEGSSDTAMQKEHPAINSDVSRSILRFNRSSSSIRIDFPSTVTRHIILRNDHFSYKEIGRLPKISTVPTFSSST
jgi:hypothetical protein